jgi:hypothetical protein
MGVGPFDIVHLGGPVRATAAVNAWPMVRAPSHLLGVAAELDEVAARAFGLDAGFRDQHGVPFGHLEPAMPVSLPSYPVFGVSVRSPH